MRKDRLGRFSVVAAGNVFIVSIGYLDYSLGFGFNLFPLYLIPLALVAWREKFYPTLLTSLVAGTAIILKVLLTSHLYAHTFFWYWDAAIKVSLLVLFSVGLWRIRQLELARRAQSSARISALNASLRQQVEQLTAANRELAEVSYTISHDLRAPLRHIVGFVELLSARSHPALDHQSRHYLEVISQSTQQMGKLIDGLLGFSQLGRTELVKTRLDLGKVVRETVREQEKELGGRKIQWEVGQLPPVDGDAEMLRLVMHNLISNAVKFTLPRPLPRIEIGAEEGPGETIVHVSDNGVGFDMRYVHKLFGIFQRLHKAEEFEGTGVGLAQVKRVIERHGGRVWAEASVDGGATFRFSLPKHA